MHEGDDVLVPFLRPDGDHSLEHRTRKYDVRKVCGSDLQLVTELRKASEAEDQYAVAFDTPARVKSAQSNRG